MATVRSATATARSADGTTIAFDRSGEGPALVLVVGAFCDRLSTKSLAALLALNFTVYEYDRRGRGASGDTAPYSAEREIEDLDAVVAQAGGSAFVFGHSSGAVLALRAAAAGVSISRLAVYEPPFFVDESRPQPAADIADRLTQLVSSGRRGDAVELFMVEGPGVSREVVKAMRSQPMWPAMEALAHTLAYDVTICGPGNAIPTDLIATIRVPTLAVAGGVSPDWARNAVLAVAGAIPGARQVTLDGQDHGVADDVIVPLLREFFS